MSVNWLFLDMNAFFASVEQAERPSLRGKPIAVAPVRTDRTCCIAVSYEAKRWGIRTGTPVGKARSLCPKIQIVEARPQLYVTYHHRIIDAVDTVLPIEEICSIDEMACRLGNGQRSPQQAIRLAGQVKDVLRQRLGDYVLCSVGLAPNKFLAKVGSNMQKPNGLTLISPEDIPHKMFSLSLNDLTGIGPRMLHRLRQYGITTVEQLYQQNEHQLQQIWHSLVGRHWWYLLRGYDVVLPPPRRRSLGHSHVLPPMFRNESGARGILLRLIHKGAARMRRIGYWATRMNLHVSFLQDQHGWRGKLLFPPCQDTSTFVELFAQQWRTFPKYHIPFKVSVTFEKLLPSCSVTRSLLPQDRRRQQVAETMDAINQQFGVDCLYLAAMHHARHTAPARIAFAHIPDVEREGPTDFEQLHHWEHPLENRSSPPDA